VTVGTTWSGRDDRSAVEEGGGNGAHAVVAEHLPRARSAWNCARALLTADPLQAHYSWSPSLSARLAELVDSTSFDVIHVEHLRGARYGLALATGTRQHGSRHPPVFWDSVDCISSLFRRAWQQSESRRVRLAARLELRRTERYEGRMLRRFDHVLVTSDADRRDLLALAERQDAHGPVGRVDVLPNGVDLEYFTPADRPRQPMTLVVTGKMSYHANATAVIRFVTAVMPAVWATWPETRLMIVGKDPPREVVRLGDASGWSPASNPHALTGARAGRRVVVTGTVDDIRPFLRCATLAIAPIQYGVGIQNKVLEALACGTPVVATREATSALAAQPGRDLIVVETPGELARAIGTLLGDADRQRQLGLAGRTFVERHHSWAGAAARLAEIYVEAIG